VRGSYQLLGETGFRRALTDQGRNQAGSQPRKMLMKKRNWAELVALTSIFSVELPGIEPVVLAH